LAPFVDAPWGDPFSLHYPTLAGHLVFGCGQRPRYVILAKLSGENFVSGMADWVKLRQEQLAEVLGLVGGGRV
jgi:hypothetical protein